MKLAVTGGTGFVGSHLIDAALAAGHEVQALARREQPERDRVQWIGGSLDDRDALERLGSAVRDEPAGAPSGRDWSPL